MREGWKIKRLYEICEKITDGTHQTPKYYSEGVIFLSSKNVTSGVIDWENVKYIDNKQHEELHKRVAPRKNDILLAKNGTTGVAAIVDKDVIFDIYVSLAFLRPLPTVFPLYLLHFINSPLAKAQFNKRLKGIGVPNLHLNEIREVEIPLPPLPEQQKIVSILDEAFAAIAKAKENTEKNLKNAKELFESYLQSVFENKGEGWEEESLQYIVSERCTLSYGIVQPGNEYSNGLPIVRPTDLKSKYITLNGLKLIDPSLARSNDKTTLNGDELLLCVRGDTGVVSIASPEIKGANVTRGIVPIAFNLEKINIHFGYYQFISSYIQHQIKGNTYGAALMQINIADIRKLKFKVPSKSEQQEIVSALNNIHDNTSQLLSLYKKKLDDLEELKKSLLQKAFSGELTESKVAELV